MKRLGRVLHHLSMCLSLLLLLATVGLWVRSYWISDVLLWFDWAPDQSFSYVKSVWCTCGGIEFSKCRNAEGEYDRTDNVHFQHDRQPATTYPTAIDGMCRFFFPKPARYAGAGFEWIPQFDGQMRGMREIGCRYSSLTLPLYFPTVLFTLLPAHYVLRVRRRRHIASRRARGCCVSCGYDLRASAERCPECGRDLAWRGT